MALIHLDAGVVIGLLDADDAHHLAAAERLARARARRERFAMATSALAECLVAPSRTGAHAVDVVRSFVARLPIDLVPLDERVAVAAAELRARQRSIRLHDAIVLASAVVSGADVLLTTDRGWPTDLDTPNHLELEVLTTTA